MASLAQFARRIRERGERIEVNVSKEIRSAAGAILQTVVLATPVDSGRARGAWQVGLDSAIDTRSERLDPSGSAAISQGKSRIGSQKSGQTIFLSNNVEYIGSLNDGSSAQAPANFVAAAVSAGASSIKGAKVVGK